MTAKFKAFTLLTLLALILAACNMPGFSPTEPEPSEEEVVLTEVAQTVVAQLTQAAEAPTSETPPPDLSTETPIAEETPTITPSSTAVPSTTPTSTPANWAQFIDDITYPDGSEVNAGAAFTKTWRLKNIGTSTWTSGYDLIFDHGDQMGAPSAVQLTSGTVSPGATVDVSVNLTAPTDPGAYQGYFRLRSSDNIIFGIGGNASNSFWVKIVVPEPTAVPDLPDLIITDITLVPYPPIQHQPVLVKVSVYNQGATTTTDFAVEWWASENAPSPAITWVVHGGMVKNGGQVLQSAYSGYSSWYAKLTIKAVADSGNAVAESNESNNVTKKIIKVSQQ